ncbi:MAG TPA: SH3 domain-containing protein [Clostridiaceae bacterium]|nr:SH3 domain-containing protein [Clostridiaceae bacterium]
MERHKKINTPFLLLILLFMLSQTAFALSATISYDSMAGNVQGNITEEKSLNINIENQRTDNNDQTASFTDSSSSLAATSGNTDIFQSEPIPAATANIDLNETEIVIDPEINKIVPAAMIALADEPKSEIKSEVRYVNADKLNVREKPTKDSNLITSITRGDKVTYYETVGEWARITTSTDKNGYVLAEYLVDSADKTIKPVVKYVNADKLNVREKATKDSKLITSITRGDKVTYYETVGEWARITTWKDQKGYVLAKYLVSSADKVENTVSRSATTSGKTEAAQPLSTEGQTLADKIVEYSKTLLGVPYVWGGHSTKGFDCSGFTQYVFAKFGIKLPSSSYAYASIGTKVSRSELQKGDILLWDTEKNGTVGHVGIYIGNGMFIHASSSKKKVVTRSLATYSEKYLGARRVIK